MHEVGKRAACAESPDAANAHHQSASHCPPLACRFLGFVNQHQSLLLPHAHKGWGSMFSVGGQLSKDAKPLNVNKQAQERVVAMHWLLGRPRFQRAPSWRPVGTLQGRDAQLEPFCPPASHPAAPMDPLLTPLPSSLSAGITAASPERANSMAAEQAEQMSRMRVLSPLQLPTLSEAVLCVSALAAVA